MQTILLTPETPDTLILDADALVIARQVARGSYQESLVEGRSRWSGADLSGAARKYLGRYADSRRALLAKCREAGLEARLVEGANGRLVAVLSSTANLIDVRKISRTVRELFVD